MNKDAMIDNVIRRFGFESEPTIWFCSLAEKVSTADLRTAFNLLGF